ncbi:MAG: hypothetical protein HDS11_07880 [Bacteroides sp.]|nr:hypothetical protein [Bacteroides sp.]MBD5376965.1 hypothetical protein [Bacteroides sp.]
MSEFLDTVLHTIFVIVANIIGWGMLVAVVIGFIRVYWAIITGEGNHKGNTPGLPWL